MFITTNKTRGNYVEKTSVPFHSGVKGEQDIRPASKSIHVIAYVYPSQLQQLGLLIEH